MALTDVTNSLIANVSSTEQSTSAVDINRSTGNPSFASNIATFTTYQGLVTGNNVITLPVNPCYQVYIRNLDTAATIIVNWQPNTAGGAANITLLQPGDQIILWQKPGGTNAGIVSLNLIGGASPTLVEYFLGG